jgi:GNAT superfamily N-acetyltransferase
VLALLALALVLTSAVVIWEWTYLSRALTYPKNPVANVDWYGPKERIAGGSGRELPTAQAEEIEIAPEALAKAANYCERKFSRCLNVRELLFQRPHGIVAQDFSPKGRCRMIDYQLEPDLSAEEFIDVLVRSTLAERRPVNDRATIAKMLAHADVLVTARQDGRLVGVSRAISDFSFCTYLSDLAVDQAFQGQGIGRELIRRTHVAAGIATNLVLLAAPKAQTYYPHIGMTKHESCWTIPRQAPNNKG